eukprot:450022_1
MDQLNKQNDLNINTKFISTMEDHHAMKKCNDEKQSAEKHVTTSYSFGYRYYYWSHYKDREGGWDNMHSYKELYMQAKYKDLRDELVNNNIHKLSKYNLENVIKTANEKFNSEYAKCITAPIGSFSLRDKYEIEAGSNISMEHLISVILYCNYSKLSFEFTKTFRKNVEWESLESCKQRNKEFAIWSRLLRETVEIYGTEIWTSKINILYHGISCKLVFESFISYFSSPTSCTVCMSVATVFARGNGIILELEQDHPYLRYFSCPWLSHFAAEDERLLVGGWRPIKVGSIRSINNNEDYRVYVHALSFFNYCVVDDNPMDGSKANPTDYRIITRFIKHKDVGIKYKNKFPIYMNDIFQSFCKNKTKIKINMKKINYSYKVMTPLFFSNENKYLFLVNNICNLFQNCKTIQIDYAGDDKPHIGSFLNVLLKDLIICCKTLNIILYNIKYTHLNLSDFKSEFIKHNWLIKEE